MCSHWRRFIGGLSAAVFAVVLLAAPALAAGTLELNPSQGAAGDEFLISGGGFEASEQIKLKWNGSPIGPPVRANADGEFTAIRSIPIDASLVKGSHGAPVGRDEQRTVILTSKQGILPDAPDPLHDTDVYGLLTSALGI